LRAGGGRVEGLRRRGEEEKEENPRQIRETEGKKGCKTARKILA